MATNRALSNGAFQKQLAFGQIAETDIARWILSRGSMVLPIYDIEYDTGKGPRLFGADGNLIAPDLLVVGPDKKVTWIEAKHKTVFSWHRKTNRWVTGIDCHHYRQYLEVEAAVGWPVWLLFLHRSSQPDARDRKAMCPPQCPTGLYGGLLSRLRTNENHRHTNWGKHGMVYWCESKLTRLATLAEIQPPEKLSTKSENGRNGA